MTRSITSERKLPMAGIAALSLAISASGAWAQQSPEMARVLAATPVIQQVAMPQQVCSNETIYNDGRTNVGALLGAVIGGMAGHAIGGGSGRAAATAAGVFGGAIVGDQIESGQGGYRDVQHCTTQTSYENRIIGYDVDYEYAGQRYTTRTAQDPGQWLAVQIQPSGAVYPQDLLYGTTTPDVVPGVVVDSDGYAEFDALEYNTPAPLYSAPPVYMAPLYSGPAWNTTIEYRGSYRRPPRVEHRPPPPHWEQRPAPPPHPGIGQRPSRPHWNHGSDRPPRPNLNHPRPQRPQLDARPDHRPQRPDRPERPPRDPGFGSDHGAGHRR